MLGKRDFYSKTICFITNVIFILQTFVHLGLSVQIAVSINGETLIKRYDKLHLNCSTDTIPNGNAIDIKVNEKTYTTVTLFNGECFSTVFGKKCSPDICECSSIGLWFTHVYQANEPEGIIDITCTMIFRQQGTLSDSYQVRIIGKNFNFWGESTTEKNPRIPL